MVFLYDNSASLILTNVPSCLSREMSLLHNIYTLYGIWKCNEKIPLMWNPTLRLATIVNQIFIPVNFIVHVFETVSYNNWHSSLLALTFQSLIWNFLWDFDILLFLFLYTTYSSNDLQYWFCFQTFISTIFFCVRFQVKCLFSRNNII